MRPGAIGGLLVVAACVLGLVAEAIAIAGGSVGVRSSSPGGIVLTLALTLLAGGAAVLGLSGPPPLDSRVLRVGLVMVGLGIAMVMATSDVPASSMLVVVYLLGGVIAFFGAVSICLALLPSTGELRRIVLLFLAGLLIAAVGGGIANAATSDVAPLVWLAAHLPTPLALAGSWLMLAAVAWFGLLGIRTPERG
jgi:hypothetical protein